MDKLKKIFFCHVVCSNAGSMPTNVELMAATEKEMNLLRQYQQPDEGTVFYEYKL